MPTFTAADGSELHYYQDDFTDPWRETPVVLLQHGFSRSGLFWYPWVPFLGNGYRVLRPDMRGLGRSQVPEDQYSPSLDALAGDLVRLLDTLGIPKVVYVGESFGGIVGLKLAHDYPDRVRALVLVNTPCRLPGGELRRRFSAGGDWERAMGQGVGNWSRQTLDMRLDTHQAPQGLQEWYIAEMDRTSSGVAQKLQAYLDTLDFRGQLKGVSVPTLLLVGELTPTSPLEQQEFMASQIPDCRLVVFPGVGHGINAIYPERCVAELRQFLAGLDEGNKP